MAVNKESTALVLSGGGTRGAYEAGVISYIRTKLPPNVAKRLSFKIQSGSSVGAINAAFMVSLAHDPIRQGQEIVHLWRELRTHHIYRRGPFTLGKLLFRTAVGVLSHLVGLKGIATPDDDELFFQGLFDTQPFFHFLMQSLPWTNISKNIQKGTVDALTISATNLHSGKLELFLEKRKDFEHDSRLVTRVGKISPRHVMASAALPVLFPPVPIHGVYYNDGGIRLNTPLSPAVSLGATQILLIGTRNRIIQNPPPKKKQAYFPQPSLADILGKSFNAILLDRLEADQAQLDRINRILDACKKNTSPETFEAICQDAQVHPIKTLAIFPSIAISTLVDEELRKSYRSLKSMGVMERTILRLLEIDVDRGSDLLSFFLFEPTYLNKLIDLGFEDARARHDEIMEFVERAISDR